MDAPMENIARILNTYASSASEIRLAMSPLPALSACFKLKTCSPCNVAVAAIRPLLSSGCAGAMAIVTTPTTAPKHLKASL